MRKTQLTSEQRIAKRREESRVRSVKETLSKKVTKINDVEYVPLSEAIKAAYVAARRGYAAGCARCELKWIAGSGKRCTKKG